LKLAAETLKERIPGPMIVMIARGQLRQIYLDCHMDDGILKLFKQLV
jgi:hypothetical protein